ncbi:MAG TPA: serine/threonine-protein kinase PknK, partial [Myxococcaceae bacterium]
MELVDRFDHLVRLTAHDGATTFRARDTANGSPVLLRTLDAAFPSPEEVVRLERELAIGRDLRLPGLLPPQELLSAGGKPASVLPDPGLEPLSARLERGPLPLADALRMGRHLARALAALHDADLVHTGLCPATVLLSAHGEDARIFDVRSATRVPRTQQTVVSAELLRGSLPHLAPEQTGRMNRAVDYRSDLYALGTVLYHALVGHPPFQGRSAMALVHAHIAQAPAPLDEVDASVPATVAALVGRLLAKNAEDRYQSALGVAHDLDRCLQALEATGSVVPFELGGQDHSRVLRVSERLYGRDAEVARLMAAFAAAADGERRLLLVSGYSGIGKSVLVHEVHRPIVERRGYFLSGKFEQLAQAEPLDGLRQALRHLVGQVLTESEAQLETWRQRLLPALESDGGVVTQLLPEVSHIVGDQPPVMELGPAEGRRRFDAVLVRFIQAFAGPGHPLVLFLDDLQWVDAASLRVLSALLHSEASRNLLVICSYRDNEVDAAHPFLLATEAWQQAGVHMDRIELAPLAGIDLRALVADSLEMSHADVAPLADVVQQKTGGNPFFVNQYLRSLVDDGLIALAPGDAGWTWNIDAIRLRQVTGGVVDLMVRRTAHYPEETRHLLELASVLGNTFSLNTLALVGEVTPNAVARALDQPVLDGHVIPIGFAHDYYRWSEEGTERAPPAPGSYKFAHDRVQEAARSRIAAADIEAIHLRIGRLLMADLGDAAQDERLFDVVNNLNKARARLDAAERDRLVGLDLVAARRAKAATAYATALEYAQAGLDLLGPEGWERDYTRTFAFVRKRIELEFLSGNMARAAEVFAHASTRVRGSRDIGDIYQLMIRISHTNNDIAEGMRLGRECLSAHFGIDLPTEGKAATAAQAADMARIQELLGGRPLAELVGSPVVTDPNVEVAQGLLHETWTCAVMAGDGQMVTLTALALVRSSLEHGHSKFSACGYVAQAMVMALTGQYAKAGEYGRLAMDLCHRFEDVFIIPKVHNTYANFTNHMVNHVRTNIPIYEESYRCCHQSGDRWWGSWAVGFVRLGKLVAGLPLPEVLETQQRFHGYIESSGYVPLTYMSVTDRQIARNLMGLTPQRLSMDEP